MNSAAISDDLAALKQLDKSLNSAENLFLSLSQNKSLDELETVINAPPNKKN